MRHFSRKLILKYILFGEIVFLFSLLSAFLAIHVLNLENGENRNFSTEFNNSSFKNVIKNYKILNLFLKKPDPNHYFPKITNPKLKKSLNEKFNDFMVKDEFRDKPLIRDFQIQKKAEMLLKENKNRQAGRVISKLNSKYDFIEHQKNKILLNSLYGKKNFKSFVDLFNRNPQNNPQMKVFFIYSLIKTSNTQKAFDIFEDLFKKNRISLFKEILPRQTLKSFVNKLDFEFWFEKFRYLAENNAFTEIFIMRKYVNIPQLFSLFYAEYNYLKKRYGRAENLLKQIKSEELFDYRDMLFFKINLRKTEKDFTAIINTINNYNNDEKIFSDLLFDSAGILLLKERYNLALKLYTRYINSENTSNNPNYWKALWLSAWLNYRNNNKEAALEFFKKGTYSPILGYRIANQYWAFQLGGKKNTVLEQYPFSYYYVKVFQPGNKSAQFVLKPFLNLINQEPSPLFLEIVDSLKTLIKHQLVEESLQLIKITKYSSKLFESDMNMLKIIESLLYLKNKDYYHAFIKFRDNFSCYQCIYLPRFLSQIYLPVQHQNLVKKYGRIYDIDPFLILALIREESFFKIDAVSRARAYGLMQLLFYTAREVAFQSGEKIYRKDLFKPESNIRFGTEYLKLLIDKYNGKIHFALAAYNAGFDRVDRWIKIYGDVSDDEFIEMIPFSETRVYVKNIIRNYFYYRFYHGQQLKPVKEF